MTTIATVTSADEPPNINTLERKIIWAGSLLSVLNPTLTFTEQANNVQLAAQFAIFKAADNQYKALIRCCIPMSDSFLSDKSQKFWMYGQELSNTPVNANYKVA